MDVRALLVAALPLAFACAPSISVTVVGQGEVHSGSRTCRERCSFPETAGQPFIAVPDEGWTFAGWKGDCAGDGPCAARSGMSVLATFERAPTVDVRVVGTGSGIVTASDGRACTNDCVWSTTEPMTLSATANEGSRFNGFSGDCLGVGPCVLSVGKVIAAFELVPRVRVAIVGDGGGTVTVGQVTCSNSCEVEVDASPVLVSAVSDPSSFPPVLTGACTATPCLVTGPAFISVEFRRGRRVAVSYVGSGSGTVFVNGAATCLGASCETVVPRDASFEVSAAPTDDYSSFKQIEGEGCTTSPCVVGPGSSPVELRVSFESVMTWYRTLDATGHALSADEVAITLAIVGGGSIAVDGTRYSVAPLAAPTMGMILQFDWDAGTQWVLPLNSHQNQDANPLPEFADIARLADGGVVVSGSCSQGRLNGAVACGPLPTPLVIFVGASGALDDIQTDTAFGGSTSQQATIFDLHEVGARLVGFRGMGNFAGIESGGLGYIGRGDAGFTPLFSVPGNPANIAPILNHCSDTGSGLRCIFFHSGAFTLDSCSIAAGTGVYQPVLVEFDGELRCQRGFRISSGALGIAAPSSSRDAGSLLFGITAPSDFGSGFTTQTFGTWIAEWEGNSITRLGQNLQYSNPDRWPTRATRVERLDERVITQTSIDLQPGYEVGGVFGVRHIKSAISIDVLDANDLATPLRHWAFTDSTVVPMQLLKATPFRLSRGKVVVLVTGVNVAFGSTSLANDNQLHTHLVVLQP